MVNHVRTRLLNLPPLTSGVDRPGEEYVPPDFVPAALPAALAAAREALLGPGADRTGANLTLARLLTYLHYSELAADALLADARVTYDPAAPAAAFGALGPAATTLSGPAAVAWAGPARFRQPGRGGGRWVVEADGAGNATTAGEAAWAGPVVATTAGDAVPLPGTDLGLVVPTGAAGRWLVTLTAAPAWSFTRAADVGEGGAVFRPAVSAAEARWYAAWVAENPPPLRACAFALALAARIDELVDG